MKTELEKAIARVVEEAKAEAIRDFVAKMGEAAGVQGKRARKPQAQTQAQAAAPKPAKTTAPQVAKVKPPKAKALAKAMSPKRSEEELAAISARLIEHITKNPGQGVEAIGKALAVETDIMRLPLKKLIASGSLRTEGAKRATKYFVLEKAPEAPEAPKGAKASNGAARRVVVTEQERAGAET